MSFALDGSANRVASVERSAQDTQQAPVAACERVCRDMEAIFALTASKNAYIAPSPAPVATIIGPPSPPPQGLRWQRGSALAAVLVAGALITAAFLVQKRVSETSPKEVVLLEPHFSRADTPSPRYNSLPLTRPLPDAPDSPVAPLAQRAVVEKRNDPKPAKIATTKHRPASAVTHGSARQEARRNARQPCEQLENVDLAWCMRPRLLRADRQLREAYEEAIHAGVDRRLLSASVRQWSRWRRKANSDPHGAAVRYQEITEQLRAARSADPYGDI